MEIDVFFTVYRDEVDMGVRNFEAQYHDGYPFAVDFFLYFPCDSFGEDDHSLECPIVEVENIVGLLFRYDQRVAFGQRIDVEKGVITVVLGYFIAGDFAPDDFGENSRHAFVFYG